MSIFGVDPGKMMCSLCHKRYQRKPEQDTAIHRVWVCPCGKSAYYERKS